MDNNFKLGSWLVDPSQCTIENEAGCRTVEPKAMALLVTLAEAEGGLVTRSEIFEAIWKDQVVTDYALNTLMANLRKSLNTGKEETQYIETRSKIGYRLTPEIEWLTPLPTQKKTQQSLIKYPIIITVILILTLIFSVHLFYNSFINESPNQNSENQKIKYFSKVVDTVSHTKKMANGNPYCIDRAYELVTHAYYLNKQWTLSNDLYEVDLQHSGESLIGAKESYHVEFIGTIGVVSAEVNIFFKSLDDYIARSKWKVLDGDKQIICEGNSIVTGERL